MIAAVSSPYLARLTRLARPVATATVHGWSYVSALALATAGGWSGWEPAAYALGVLAAAALAVGALSAAALAALPRLQALALAERWQGVAWDNRSATAGVAAAVTAAAAIQVLLPGLLRNFAEVPQLTFAATAFGCAGAATLGVWSAQAWTHRDAARISLWVLPVLFGLARIASVESLVVVAVAREYLLETAGLVIGVVGCLGIAAHRTALLASVPMGVAMLWLLFTVADHRVAAADFAERYPGAAGVLRGLRAYVDLDGDGHAAAFGGRDCDDSDPRVGPMAIEIVGNGIDDNCMGGDLKATRSRAEPQAPAAQPELRSVVLVTIDAWNHRMLPPQAPDGADPMPNVRAMAQVGAHFTRAYSQANATSDGLMSLHTGEYPMRGRLGTRSFGLPPPLAYFYKLLGYETVSAVGLQRARTWPLRTGFSLVDERVAHDAPYGIHSPELTAVSLEHLQRLLAAGKPFFYWVHYTDPHMAYVARESTPFGGRSRRDRYHQEIYAVDRDLGPVFALLERSGFFERGILAVTGDHGEGLSPRTPYGHAWWLYEDCIRTPMVLRGAGVEAGIIDTRVRLVDLAPTLLSLSTRVRLDVDGESLAPLWRGGQHGDRTTVSVMNYHGRHGYAYLEDRYKLITDHFKGSSELYDVDIDPDERDNLIESRPELATRMQAALGRLVDRAANDRTLGRKLRASRPR